MHSSFFDFKVFVIPESAEVGPTGRGAAQKGLLILYAPGDEAQEDLDRFLGKILQAMDYELERDAWTFCKTPHDSLSLPELIETGRCQHVLLFGLSPDELGLPLPITPYQPIQHEGITLLPADDLPTIYQERRSGGKARSVQLWTMLKETFLA